LEKLSILIVGAGLAGTSLAQRLLEKKQQVTLIDSGQNNSTAIAAGIINPMVFRRMNKSWRVDDFLQEAIAYYKKLEDDLKIKLIRPLFLRRLFSSLQEKEFWENRQFEKEYSAYLEILTTEDLNYSLAKNEFGSGRVKQAYWIEAQIIIQHKLTILKGLGLCVRKSSASAILTLKKEAIKIVFMIKLFLLWIKQWRYPIFF
jgi:FAD dependent oxidoreductase.